MWNLRPLEYHQHLNEMFSSTHWNVTSLQISCQRKFRLNITVEVLPGERRSHIYDKTWMQQGSLRKVIEGARGGGGVGRKTKQNKTKQNKTTNKSGAAALLSRGRSLSVSERPLRRAEESRGEQSRVCVCSEGSAPLSWLPGWSGSWSRCPASWTLAPAAPSAVPPSAAAAAEPSSAPGTPSWPPGRDPEPCPGCK